MSDDGALRVSRPRKKLWAPRVRTGCITCRKRRIKCDETRPVCNKCVFSDRQCQGYMLAAPSNIPPLLARSPASLPQFNSTQQVQDVLHLLPRINETFSTITDDIRKTIFSKVELLLAYLPSQAGYGNTLDAAVKCVATGLQEAWGQKTAIQSRQVFLTNWSPESLQLYIPAVSALRHALEDPDESVAAETLLAALLLCCFDAFKRDNLDTLKHHLHGISKIFHHRGACRFTTTFELDLFYHSMIFISLSSYWANMPCYLYGAEWEDLTEYVLSQHKTPNEFLDGSNRYLRRITGWASQCSALVKHNHHNGKTPQPWHISVLEQITATEQTFINWYHIHTKTFSQTQDGTDAIALMRELHESADTRPVVETIGKCMLGIITSHRFRVALDCPEVLEVEKELQSLARRLNALHDEFSHDESFPVIFTLKLFTKATLATREEWRKDIIDNQKKGRDGRHRMISAEAFGKWLRLAGVHFEV